MPDRPDVTTDYVTDPWVHPPTPGTPSYRHVEADLRAQSEAEVHAPLSAEGKWVHAWAAERIERAVR